MSAKCHNPDELHCSNRPLFDHLVRAAITQRLKLSPYEATGILRARNLVLCQQLHAGLGPLSKPRSNSRCKSAYCRSASAGMIDVSMRQPPS